MATGQVEFHNGYPTAPSARRSFDETDLRRAVEAYRFFYPTVSMEAILRGTRAVGGVPNKAGALLVANPLHVGFTPNSDTPYLGGGLDLREAEPMVIELRAELGLLAELGIEAGQPFAPRRADRRDPHPRGRGGPRRDAGLGVRLPPRGPHGLAGPHGGVGRAAP